MALSGDGIGEGLDLLEIGLGIFDAEGRLEYCNPAFRRLRRYPDDLCRLGVTLEGLIRFNAERGDFGPGDRAKQVAERMAEIGAASEREVEREMADGQILGIRYRRTPSGKLMITFEDRTAERRARAALAASEQRYALVADAAEEAIYEWDIAGERFFASPRLEAMVGRDWGEGGARHWDWEDIVHPDDRAHYSASLEAHLVGAEPRWRCEYRMKDASGAWRWVRDHGTSIRGEDGRAVRMVAAIRDVTERVEKDAALAASEERHMLVTRATSDGIYDWNVPEKRLWVSDRLSRDLGFDAAAEGSDGWFARVHPDDKDAYLAAIIAHLKGETDLLDIDYRARVRGAWRWIHDRGIGVRGVDGRVTRLVGAMRDVTERVEKDAALAASEERHTLVSRATSDGIYDWNVTDDLLYVSDNLIRILDFDFGIKASGMWAERVHPDDYERYVKAIREHFRGHTEALECEYRVRGAGGDYRWILDRGIGVRGANGRVTRMVGAVRDITEVKEARAELDRTEALLASSLATISDGILLVDGANRVQLWNDRYYQIFSEAAGGADLGAVIVKGRRFDEMIHDGYNLGMFKLHADGVDAWVAARMKAWAQPASQWELELANGTWILLNERAMPDGGRVSVYTDITELKRREEEAKAARQRFEDAIESLSTGFALFDAEDRLTVWNARFRDYFSEMADVFVPGATFREMIAASIERGLFPAAAGDPEGFLKTLLERRQKGIGQVRENLTSSGLWLQITDHRTKEGGLVSIYTDVTELKTGAQQAQAARERFEEAIEAISSGFVLFDAEDRLVVCNDRFRDYFVGLADMVAPGVQFADLLRAGLERGMFDESRNAGFLDRLLEARAQADGTPRERYLASGLWLQITDHRTKDGGIVSIYTDVTELKHRQQEAQAARQRFEEAIEAISSGFSLWDAEGRMVTCNSRYRELYASLGDVIKPGVSIIEALTVAATKGLVPAATGDTEAYIEEHLRKREAGLGQLREHRLADGTWLHITDHRTADGGIVSVHTDVTELKNREEEIRRQSAILEQTLENMGQGITMVDSQLRTVAYNRKFFELMEFPADRFGKGFTMEQAFRFNAERGEYGTGDVEEQVRQRMELAAKFLPHRFERIRPDGTVLEIVGNPMEGGGLVATYTDITERKRAEEALKAALAEFNAVLDNIDYGIMFMGPDLRARIINRALGSIWNIPQEFIDQRPHLRDLLEYNRGKGLYDVTPDDWDAWVEARVAQVAAGDIPPSELHRADGVVLRIQCVALPDGGRMLTYFDITDMKRAEEELRARETRLETALSELNVILDHIDYGVILLDTDKRARVVNRVMMRLWNFPEGFAERRPTIREMIEFNRDTGIYDVAPEDWDRWIEARIAHLTAGPIPPTEMHRANGTVLRYQCVALPDGGRMLTYFDITEMKRAEQLVRDSESRLRGILENSPIGVAVIDDEDIIHFHNARFAEILHGPGQNLVGTSSKVFRTDHLEVDEWKKRFRKDGSVAKREMRYRGLDGGDVWSQSIYERTMWQGRPARLTWIYDITEEKANREALVVARDAAEAALADLQKAQARLVQAEKMASLGQLTAGIAHEIKNPLNFVNNFAKLSDEMLGELAEILEAPIRALDSETRDDAEDLLGTVRENLAKINEHGRRADSIVKNMLLHSRDGPSERQTLKLNAIAEEALNLAYHGARAENPNFNIEMAKSLDPEVGAVECFPQDLMRVFLNLIANGMYAANKRALAENGGFAPAVGLTTRANGDRVEVEIRDNGSGIPAEIREKIFTPFFTTKPAGEGTGLGLSLSFDIVVKQHGGELTVESEPGNFTAFRVALPRRLPASEGDRT